MLLRWQRWLYLKNRSIDYALIILDIISASMDGQIHNVKRTAANSRYFTFALHGILVDDRESEGWTVEQII